MENNILITICARGGSKEIPGKNIKLINGLPLIAYTIKHAKMFGKYFSCNIGLSTDSLEIKKVASNFGLHTSYTRSPDLANDTAGKLDVIKDLIEYEEQKSNKKFDFILDLDVTSPLRTINDLKQAFLLIKQNKEALNLFSVSIAKKNPYFNMVEEKEDGYFSLVKNIGDILSRQKAPKVYELNASFYFYRREYFNLDYKTAISNKSLVYVMDHICFDLDELVDFYFMEYLLQNNLLDFQL
ncbi:MAG: CMP-N,N'-diacetyllegionaminic acid synthase [Marinilabiliales bacterium]